MEKAMPLGRAKDLTGQQFGRLTAIERVRPYSLQAAHYVWWRCKCECGQVVTIMANSLQNGLTRSCGCLRREMMRKNGRRRSKGGAANG